jgi:hypothetical protein
MQANLVETDVVLMLVLPTGDSAPTMDWQLGGFAVVGSSGQLVQAMASFGGGGAAGALSTVPIGSDTSQQPLLTTPQHA